ncbi:hypothetical protein CL614_01385 [archaeon]|nr:hypothetical protein [archaeon]|tara:strand:- start:151 stop:432 length:282 start_codon:yes stop_codon:yes gene_type:complete
MPGYPKGSRGNKRTREGPGRHTITYTPANAPVTTKVRICIGKRPNGTYCNSPFLSKGPWNRFCGRCHEEQEEHQRGPSYGVPEEWPAGVTDDL